jgi:hypothetical protein
VTGAAKLIEELLQSGVVVSRSGKQLVLDGPEALITDGLIDRVRALKSEILRNLEVGDSEDWETFFNERAGIAQREGSISRSEAETVAFVECVHHWLAMHPPASCSLELCAYCRHTKGEVGRDCIPFLRGRDDHFWLHHKCISGFRAARNREAELFLRKIGLL